MFGMAGMVREARDAITGAVPAGITSGSRRVHPVGYPIPTYVEYIFTYTPVAQPQEYG